MHLILPKMTWPSHQIQILITVRFPIQHNYWNVKSIWLPFLLHRMQTIQCYLENVCSHAKMKTVNSWIIQQLFVHLLSKICASAISSDTVTHYLYIEKKDINLLFITSSLNLTFYYSSSEAYAQTSYQLELTNALRSTSQQWSAQTY